MSQNQTAKSNEIEKDIDSILSDKISQTKQRLKLLSKKLNTYIQANGCSDKLKEKSHQCLCKEETENG